MVTTTYTYDNICFYSYNSRGFGDDKQDICKILTTKNRRYVSIVCNQENFVLNNNKFKIKQCLPEHHIFFKPAVMDSLQGRPKNRMFIAIPQEMKDNVQDVSPSHWRLQAVVINTLGNKILLINTYFPTDPRIQDYDYSDLLSTLYAINELIETEQYDDIVWAGDLNADFSRNSKFTSLIDDFVNEKSFTRSWDQFHVDFTHTHELDGKTFTSIIDQFHWNGRVNNNVTEAGALYLPQNTSDHCPICCIINIDGLQADTVPPTKRSSKPN